MLTRRDILKRLGIAPAALPFLANLPSLAAASAAGRPRQRLVIVFSPDGVVKKNFWPERAGAFTTPPPVEQPLPLPEILTPLEPFRDQLLLVKGVHNKVRGDGDGHMRGMGCLLTGIELFPGNIQGGSDTPAGWASGRSIDQEIREFLQVDPATATRFGSLEFGVLVPNRADTWTRMVYTGPNRPVTPIDDPYQMFDRLYGQTKDRESLYHALTGCLFAVAATLSRGGPICRVPGSSGVSSVTEGSAGVQCRYDDSWYRGPRVAPCASTSRLV